MCDRRARLDTITCIDVDCREFSPTLEAESGVVQPDVSAVEAELPEVIDFGIPSFKMFMIYKREGWQ